MKLLDPLLEGLCTIIFQLPDGSSIHTQSTLNSVILEEQGLPLEGIYDIPSGLVVPAAYYEYIVQVVPAGQNVHYKSALDEFFSIGGKCWWEPLDISNTKKQ